MKKIHIKFTPTAKTISDYDIYEEFERIKDFDEIEISNYLLFDLFRVALKESYYDSIDYTIVDKDGSIYKDKNVTHIHDITTAPAIISQIDDILDKLVFWD